MKTYKDNLTLFSLVKNKSNFPKTTIRKSEDAYNVIKQFYFEDLEIFESFFVLFLNRANVTTGYAKISQGGIVGTVVDIKIIAKYVSDTLSNAVIFAHNHPSGNTNPSPQDIELTKKFKTALSYLECSVHDHIILTENSFYSLADNGDF